MGLFSKLKNALKKTKEVISFKLNKLFTGGILDDGFYDELEEILLSADIGAATTDYILEELKDVIDKKQLRAREQVKDELEEILKDIVLENPPLEYSYPLVIMLTGVNGVGKTTAIGKLAKRFKTMGKSVTIAAADTFRAAASDQLSVWADRADVRIIKHTEGADPGAVVYDALASVKQKGTDVLLIDTAGRLHNKVNLMKELSKISKIIETQAPSALQINYIVLDATTGQNALSQVDIFDEAIQTDGIILTKIDGTAKGGIIFAINREFQVPVVYLGVGETIDDLEVFDANSFVEGIMDIGE